jgi:hypothetical protein
MEDEKDTGNSDSDLGYRHWFGGGIWLDGTKGAQRRVALPYLGRDA